MGSFRLFCLNVFVLIALTSGKRKGGLYSFHVKGIDNELTSLESYRGKISLVVNVASECAYTDEHYKHMVALYRDLAITKNEPFTILAFPCNQFGNQEPYDNRIIRDHVTKHYGVQFPLFGKTKVSGHEIDPLFTYLAKHSDGQQPSWNFWKYLVDENGAVIGNWGPRVTIMEIKDDIIAAIEKLKMKHNEL